MEPDPHGSAPATASASERSDGLAIALVLAAMSVGVVTAFDAHTMILLVWVWCATWIAVLRPRVVEDWPLSARRVIVAIGVAWTAMWLSFLVGRMHEYDGLRFGAVGWPFEAMLPEVPRQPAVVTNFVWPLRCDGCHPPHIVDSDDCLANFLVFAIGAAAGLLPFPNAGSPRVVTWLRWVAPVAALTVLAVQRLSHDRY
jgi:hypothetical protein